jgi:formylmethanofuran dehydrogenase subunit B
MCADLGAHLPKKAVEQLFKIPVVSIETAEGPQAFISDVILPGVLDGMETEGCFYRMDNVPIHARSFCKPPFDFTESNEDSLKQLFEAIKKKEASASTTVDIKSSDTITKETFARELDKLVMRAD